MGMTGIVLWDRLEEKNVTNTVPRIGSPGVISGTAPIVSAKYGKGYNLSTNGDYLTYNSIIDKTKGSIEGWVIPPADSSDPIFGGDFKTMFSISTLASAITMQYYQLDGTLIVNQTSPAGAGTPGPFSFSANVPFFAKLVWDLSGIDGTSDTIRGYINGQLIATNTEDWSGFVGSMNTDLFIGHYVTTTARDFPAIYDNIKLYNISDTNNSGRFIEGFGYQKSRIIR
jgi:hypothetical protein